MRGILNNATIKQHYDLNFTKRKFCNSCWESRCTFKEKDQKYNQSYSTLGPGFSSHTLKLPIDILIVAEAHGGGNSDGFCSQRTLEEEINGFEEYYMLNSIEKFHQQQMRILLKRLDSLGLNWVFTDLLKCFIWEKKEGELKGSLNKKIAISHCSQYLTEQINLLNPKFIIPLGTTVASYFKIKGKKVQGQMFEYSEDSKIIFSFFPSQRTADKWAQVDGWNPILVRLEGYVKSKNLI